MSSQKGITLISLVVYVIVATLVIATMALVSTFFFDNMNLIKGQEKYAPEFNKFAMFFIEDVKTNTLADVGIDKVTFEDGTIYQYNKTEKKIYRNDVVITKQVEGIEFLMEPITVSGKTKNIIKVRITIGEKNEFSKEIDFVMRYW